MKDALRRSPARLKSAIERMCGIQISRASHHGHCACFDIRKSGCPIQSIFDVGANVGVTAAQFSRAFPGARIRCFEPVRETFGLLEQATRGLAGVTCFNLALGAKEEQATVYLTGDSSASSLVKPARVQATERVDVQTIDGFAARNGVGRIDLLKIDTEGYDLEVLRGGHAMLSADRIPFVLVESGFHPGDPRHVVFEDIRSYLLPLGFAVYGIYEQHLEWSGAKRLRYANACFINENAIPNAAVKG